jgi:hypothetical protein
VAESVTVPEMMSAIAEKLKKHGTALKKINSFLIMSIGLFCLPFKKTMNYG